MAALLETRGLTRHYPMGDTVVRALDGVSLAVQEGEFLALLGASGSGKSTLLNLIAGLDRPTGGSLSVFDRDLAQMSSTELSLHRRRNVGIIFQSFNLISTMTAADNVALAMMFADVPRAERDARAAALLESVGLGGRQRHRPKELSGGEQQRVAIARALSNTPQILLADEPTGNLDSRTSREIMELLKTLNARDRRTVIMVTHDPSLAERYAHRTITMLDGQIVGESIGANERQRVSHAPAFAPKALRRGLAVASAEAETERAGEAASERVCKGVRGRKSPGYYSWRSARIGSMRLARCAGMNPAAADTTVSSATVHPAIQGSRAWMP
jgi:putative ABC transport system ATP-binding protein